MSDDSTATDADATTTNDDTTSTATDAKDTSTNDTAAQQVDKADDTQQDTTDWKAMARKHEQRAKENAAAAKELAELKKAQMSEVEKAQAAAKEVVDRAEAAERRAALLQAAVDHKLDKADLDLLDGVPADQIEDRAKKLAARLKKAGASSSGGEVTGNNGERKKATSLDSAVAGYYQQ